MPGCRKAEAAALVLSFAGDADAEVAQVGDEAVVLIGLEDHKVGSFAATLQETGAGGGIVGGGEEFDEGAVAGGENALSRPNWGRAPVRQGCMPRMRP